MFLLVLQIVTKVKYRLYLTFSFLVVLQDGIQHNTVVTNSKQALGTAVPTCKPLYLYAVSIRYQKEIFWIEDLQLFFSPICLTIASMVQP